MIDINIEICDDKIMTNHRCNVTEAQLACE